MTVAGLAYGAHVHERRCDPRPVEVLRALRPGDLDKPADVEIVAFGKLGQRYFLCPSCTRMVRALYDPDETEQWRCRRCARLDHDSRHRLRDPVIAASELRKKLGGSGSLLEPLPPRPAGRATREYDRRLVELLALEARALQKLRKMSGGLEKYGRR